MSKNEHKHKQHTSTDTLRQTFNLGFLLTVAGVVLLLLTVRPV